MFTKFLALGRFLFIRCASAEIQGRKGRTMTNHPNRKLSADERIENTIIKKTIRELLKAGLVISVNDGEKHALRFANNAKAIFDAMKSTDEDYLICFIPESRGNRQFGFVRFIYGNEGAVVINDYSTSLENILAPVNDYAASLDK